MGGQLIIFYEGPEPEHFLKGVFQFPQVLPVVANRSESLKKLAEKHSRSVLFMGADEAKMFFGPDFIFHYTKSGGKGPEELAAKIKQDFSVMLFMGRKFGDAISLMRSVDGATAASIIAYDVLKILRGF